MSMSSNDTPAASTPIRTCPGAGGSSLLADGRSRRGATSASGKTISMISTTANPGAATIAGLERAALPSAGMGLEVAILRYLSRGLRLRGLATYLPAEHLTQHDRPDPRDA
jgi:hypothetical protein